MRNVRLDVCYDGTRYKGWQRLAGTDNTIQTKLETALSRILGENIVELMSGEYEEICDEVYFIKENTLKKLLIISNSILSYENSIWLKDVNSELKLINENIYNKNIFCRIFN